MTEAKVGDKVRLVNKPVWVGAYEEGETGVVIERDIFGDAAPYGHILVALDKGVDRTYNIPHGQYEVIENDAETSFLDRKEEHCPNKDAPASSAEAIRDNILRIREKRNDLKMEIIALDKEEAELVEKLKQQGFVLYEQNVPETLATQSSAATEKKTVLYAEDIEEDMSDPKNWKVGDMIVCINRWIAPVGTLDVIQAVDNSYLYRTTGDCYALDTVSGIWKFHSRPL